MKYHKLVVNLWCSVSAVSGISVAIYTFLNLILKALNPESHPDCLTQNPGHVTWNRDHVTWSAIRRNWVWNGSK